MPTEDKAQQVAAIEEKLKRASIAISAEFRGLTVAQVSVLRRKLRENQIEMMVVKNTLAGIAAKNTGKGPLSDVLKGPSALVFGYADPVAAPRTLRDYLTENQIGLTITGGILDGRALTKADVEMLASLPTRPVLMSRLMGGLLGPLTGVVHGLNFHISGLARVLDGRRKQLEAAAAPVQAPTT